MSAKNEYEKWLAIKTLSKSEKEELAGIENDPEELNARFGSSLAFGTAGLRGKMKLGCNAMNVYTVAKTTKGLAAYLKNRGLGERKVAIAYDSRHNSRLFAETCAAVLAYNGIGTYIFDSLRPTPELSFALRHLKCAAGINITASHNPKEYNGYKVYFEDGAQISPEQAAEISECINSVDGLDIPETNFRDGVKSGLITVIGEEIDKIYLDAVYGERIDPEVIKKAAGGLNIVYTPLHGAGYRLVPEIIKRLGITHLHIVKEQAEPDGDFPTADKPNPGEPSVYGPGIRLADKTGSDLIIATDPDADRVGIAVRKKDGGFAFFNGNQTGALLLDYIISSYKRLGKMPPEPYVVKSIVTTELMTEICRSEGVEIYDVLTGFKFIGEVIKKKEAEKRGSFIFGAEESYGYLKGTYARDKDAVVSSMLICEMAAYYGTLGMTLADALDALYEKYGFSLEKTVDIPVDEYSKDEETRSIMSSFRDPSLRRIAGREIEVISDFKTGVINRMTSLRGNTTEDTGLPRTDAVKFVLGGGDAIIARPSGTEPKIKLYYLVSAGSKSEAREKLDGYLRATEEMIGRKMTRGNEK